MGRVHVDYFEAFGPGLNELAPGAAPAHGFELRRARLELAGEFFQQWQWQIGAEFAPSTASNVAASAAGLSCKVNATTSALTCNPAESTVDAPSVESRAHGQLRELRPVAVGQRAGRPVLPSVHAREPHQRQHDRVPRARARRPYDRRAQPARHRRDVLGRVARPGPLLHRRHLQRRRPEPSQRRQPIRLRRKRVFVRPLAKWTTSPTKWAQIGFSVHEGITRPEQGRLRHAGH